MKPFVILTCGLSDVMVLNVRVTPIYGAQSDNHALCTFLSIDGLNILLDCGWNSSFDKSSLGILPQLAPTVHAVLLSHPDIAHLGALPYAISKLGLNAPIFATLPVWRMGHLFLQDAYVSHDADKPFDAFTLDEISSTFRYAMNPNEPCMFNLLKYQQHHPIDSLPNGTGVSIMPHRAGHMVGGALWHITKGTESIVYATHVNHRKERHLNATTLPSFSRPGHLIVSAINACTRTSEGGGNKDALVPTITRAVERGGNVLIPIDAAGRVVELAVELETAWEHDESLRAASLYVAHPSSLKTFVFARSMIEWMSDEVVKRFDVSRDNLFIFKHVKTISSLDEVLDSPRPCVVLATPPAMDVGFSRNLFATWASDRRNVIILPGRPEPRSLYAQLYEHARKKPVEKDNRKSDDQKGDESNVTADVDEKLRLHLKFGKKVSLEGEELDQWRDAERSRKRIEADKKRREQEQEAARAKAEAEAKMKETASNPMSIEPNLSSGGEEPKKDIDMVDVDVLKEESFGAKEKAEDDEILRHMYEIGVLKRRRPGLQFKFVPKSRMEWNDYGQVVDSKRFIIGEDPGEGGIFEEAERKATESIRKNAKPRREEVEDEVVPTKYVTEEKEVEVVCELVIIDWSGLSDGDSLKRMLKEVEARYVTVTSGTEEETLNLADYVRKMMGITRTTENGVSTPKNSESIEIRSEMSVYQVSLDDRLVETVEWEPVGMARMGFVNGKVLDAVDENGFVVASLANEKGPGDVGAGAEADTEAEIEMEVEDCPNGLSGHGTYFVGTMMVNKLKEKIEQKGLKVEFAGGALCVENSKTGAIVLVKKVAGQHVILEGSLCEEYLTVRDVLYNELVIPQ